MKKMTSVLCLTLCAFSNAFSSEIRNSPKEVTYVTGKVVDNKFYPLPECMYVDHKGIFVNFEGNVYKALGLFSDQQGVYVDGALVDGWKCSKGHPNPPWEDECATCGRKKGD